MNKEELQEKIPEKEKKGEWKARLEKKEQPAEVTSFLSSLWDDIRIFEDDIRGSEAHVIMLKEAGILTEEEASKILRELENALNDWKKDKLKIDESLEDIHPVVEKYVVERLGVETGGKMHTGRSRNDQVMTDVRMYIRREIIALIRQIRHLIKVQISLAENHIETVMPGYTHLQQAQITTFAHFLLSYADSLLRDIERLENLYERVNKSPLGACALAGTSFEISRQRTAELLGFEGIIENSIDATTTRDFAIETIAVLTIHQTNLSRIAEDLILWSTTEFGFLEIPDEYCSISSVMPQKKNPDTLELIRGRTSKVLGALNHILTMVKGLPSGYNRDLQETKPPLWNAIDTVKSSVKMLSGILKGLKIDKENALKLVKKGYTSALDLAEKIVKETGISFREAHNIVGTTIKKLAAKKAPLNEDAFNDLKEAWREVLGEEIPINLPALKDCFDPLKSINERKSLGSPNPTMLKETIEERKKILENIKTRNKNRETRIKESEKMLEEIIQDLLKKHKSGLFKWSKKQS